MSDSWVEPSMDHVICDAELVTDAGEPINAEPLTESVRAANETRNAQIRALFDDGTGVSGRITRQ